MPRESFRTQDDPLQAYAMLARTRSGTAVPVLGTQIRVAVSHGLAVVRTTRVVQNPDETRSMEVILTLPAPVRATVMALEAKIGDRILVGVAQGRDQARASYESGLDEGKTSVLHEEPLRGIHVLSIGHVPPGSEVEVTSTWTLPLGLAADGAGFRIPVTVGDIYGRSPLTDSDDLLAGGPTQYAELQVSTTDGQIQVAGHTLTEGRARLLLDAPIDIQVTGWTPQVLHGRAADGRDIWLGLSPAPVDEMALDAAVLVDRSGSMGERAGISNVSKYQVVRAALAKAAIGVESRDQIDLWQFNIEAQAIVAASFAAAIELLSSPNSGTGTGAAITAVLEARETRDVLLITDGKSHDIDVQAAARSGRRFHVVLIGEDSLEAHVGQLAAMTGGQLFVASGEDAASAIAAAMQAMRTPHQVDAPIEGVPEFVQSGIAGMEVRALWGEASSERVLGTVFPTLWPGAPSTGPDARVPLMGQDMAATPPGSADFARAVVALATALALPRLDKEAATALAVAEGIVCHLTSLVLVDQVGEAQAGLPVQHKLATMTPRTSKGIAAMWAAPERSAAQGVTRGMAPSGAMRSLSVAHNAGAASKSIFASSASGDWLPKAGLGSKAMRGGSLPDLGMPVVPAKTPRTSLAQLQGKVDWGMHAETLRQGDFSPLPSAILSELTRLSEMAEVRALAMAQGCSALLLALALLAATEGPTQRAAARLARAVLRDADPALLVAAQGATGWKVTA